MDNSTNIFRLKGSVQHYAWGGFSFIPQLLHLSNTENQPFAEYWMGAHDNHPSAVVLPGGSTQPLNAFISARPKTILGNAVYNRFGRLPYLFKVLDVKDMLSIQVHPDKSSAVESFEEENKKNIPVNAPHRNYKDDNHKPELMLALSEFWLLHGFKSPQALKNILQQTPELEFLLPVFLQNNYKALYKRVMEMEQAEVNERLQPLLDRAIYLYENGMLKKSQEDFWAGRAAKTFCTPGRIDRGIFSIYFFNLVRCQPGEAVFQDAGVPHAYLEGQNMEIMANSDNVLRGGLTPKHIDVPELMKHIKFEAVVPQLLKGKPSPVAAEKIFPTPVFDFELHEVKLKPRESTQLKAVTAEIYIVYKGKVLAQSGNEKMELSSGEAMLAIAGATIHLQGLEDTVAFKATVPEEAA